MEKIKIPKMAKGGIIEKNPLMATLGENNNIDKDLLDFFRCVLKKNRGIKK